MPAEMPPDRVTMKQFVRTLHCSTTTPQQKRFGACTLLNVEKTVQRKYGLYCRREAVKEGRSNGKR